MRGRARAALVLLLGLLVALAPSAAPADPPGENRPPNLNVSVPAPVWEGWHAGSVTLTATASDLDGIEALSYELSGAQTGSGSAELDTLSVVVNTQGTTTVRFVALDAQGASTTVTRTVKVDRTPPTARVTSNPRDGASYSRGAQFQFNYVCEDAETGIRECGGDVPSGTLVTLDQVGTFTIMLHAIDNVGQRTDQSITYRVLPTALRIVAQPVITGGSAPLRVGDTLKVDGAAFEPTPENVEYRWLVGNTRVATGSSLTMAPEYVGMVVRVYAFATLPGYNDTSSDVVSAGEVQPAGYEADGHPRLSGRAQVGATLEVATPAVTPQAVNVEHRWYADGELLATTDTARLVLPEGALGKRISAEVRWSGPGRSLTLPATLDGNPTGATQTSPVRGDALSVVRPAVISGQARVGARLTAAAPVLSGTPSGTTYQWLRDGRAIPGADGSSYVLRAADAGRVLSVRSTSTAAHRPDTVATSGAVRVARIKPVVRASGSSPGRGKVRLVVTVRASGAPIAGQLVVRRGKKVVARARVAASGRVVVALRRQPAGTARYRVAFAGSAALLPAAVTTKGVRVR